MKTTLNNQVYEYKEGTWSLVDTIEKANVNTNLKPEYKDLPRYKLIVTYEDFFRKEFNKTLLELNKEVLKFLKRNI